ncbi:MAG: uroporphyrinogen decarboxylase family protein [Phycisphaerae bacterium]
MKPKERFLSAIYRRPVDRVPLFDFLFQRPLYTRLIGRTPEAYNACDAMDLTMALRLDGVWIPYGCFSGWSPKMLADNIYKDEWGTTFQQNDSSWPIDAPIDYPLTSKKNLTKYRPPDPQADGRLNEINTALAINKVRGNNAVAVLGGVGGPLTISWMLVGYERICLNLYDDPGFLEQVVQMAVDFAVVAVDRMAQAGVDGMIVSEDLGSSAGGLISLKHFRRIYLPALTKIVHCIKDHQLPVILHSCGRIYDYLDDLAALEIDALHPLQRTAGMDLARIKKAYGHRMCLIGNIDSSRTLPFGSKSDIERETRETISIGAPGYGYILASDHSLHDGIPVESIIHMFDVAYNQGMYPIMDNKVS